MSEGRPRSWDSVCADCAHYRRGNCAAARGSASGTAGALDSIAAICRWFEPARREAERKPPERSYVERVK